MIKAILSDIEGTTSSLSFVKEILFPYARDHLPEFVRAHQQDPTVAKLLRDAQQEVGEPIELEDLIGHFIRWIDEDQKITSFKSLQGLIWEEGYRSGAFTGHLYPDALVNLQQWHQKGIELYIYSSGSVYAQKLLFSHTDQGDLTPLFSGFFDTRVGSKKDVASYQAIIGQIAQPAGSILFLSDIKEELDAAHEAGMQTVWLVRQLTPNPRAEHKQVVSFDDIRI